MVDRIVANAEMKRIVCYTKFGLDPFSDGGSKRSVQIRQLLAENGFDCLEDSFSCSKKNHSKGLLANTFRAVGFVQKHYPKRVRRTIGQIPLVKYCALRLPMVYDKYRGQDMAFVWENTNDTNAVFLMKATGNQVIGMPHNIESLVSKHNAEALENEMESLRRCDTVFAISKEETWLLRLFGVNAHYLPYYPPKEAEALLLQIRKEREDRKPNVQKRFLMLGSATNPPTKKGMNALINDAASRDLSFDLCVAGYHTESLRNPNHPRINIFGSLTNEALRQILVETDAVLVYQPPTTGALTRIPEMLIAGVPVFVNYDAARDYHHVDDVHQFETFDELFGLLQGFEPYQAQLYERNSQAEQSFINVINACFTP